jgi:hypothetical protein
VSVAWDYISDADAEILLTQAPSIEKVTLGLLFTESIHKIYEVASPAKIRQDDGEVIELPAGERIRLLEAKWQNEPWSYRVVSLTIKVPGSTIVEVKKDVSIAVLPQNYRQMMEKWDGDRIARGNTPEVTS